MTSYGTSVPFEIDDKNMNSKSFEPKFTTINRITTGLARIEHTRGFLESATLSENWVQEMDSLKIKTADLPGVSRIMNRFNPSSAA